MACIRKLSTNITFDCAKANPTAGIGEIDELILLNLVDVSSYSVSAGVATITMLKSTKGYVVSSVNNSVSATIAARINDFIATAQEHSIIIKVLENSGSADLTSIMDNLQKGTFVACVKTINNGCFVYGLEAGLECSEIVGDTAAGGMITITLKTPDSAGGDRMYAVTNADYEALKTPKA
nr:MAG: hypothetical protein [Bacteriophage sp.]